MIVIREGGTADVALLSKIIRDAFRDVAERLGITPENAPRHPSNCRDEWIAGDLARGVSFYILDDDAIPRGCVALEKADADRCFLKRLSVLPEERRKGFGRALVNHCFLEARTRGAKVVGIGMIAEEVGLKAWYRRIGFVEGETKAYAELPFRVTFLTYGL